MGTERRYVGFADVPCRYKSESGGARRDRTADLYNAIVALSQLSYGPSKRANISVI